MTQALKLFIESGRFYDEFRRRIGDIDNTILCKWYGKYVCEITKFECNNLRSSEKYLLAFELYSDYGLGPRVYVTEEQLDDFIKGTPLNDGTKLTGKGLKSFIQLIYG